MTENLLRTIIQPKPSREENKDNTLFISLYDVSKLESELSSAKSATKLELLKLEKYNSKMHLLQQQNEIYSHESQVILEKIKDSNWAFTKECCQQIGKLKKPSTEITDLCEKFMYMLDQKEKSWKMFQAVTKNYNSLKALMNSFNAEYIKEDQIDVLLPLWKNYSIIHPNLQRQCKEACVLLDWITGCVEFKIKKATLNNIKKNTNEVQLKIKEQLANVAEKNSIILTLETKLKELRTKDVTKTSYSSHKGQHVKEMSDSSNATNSSASTFNQKRPSLNPKDLSMKPTLQHNQSVKENIRHSNDYDLHRYEDHKYDIDESECNVSRDFRSDGVTVNQVVRSSYNFTIKKKMSVTSSEFNISSNTSSPKNIDKIHNIIKNNDPRNLNDVVIQDSKFFFVKEKKSFASVQESENNFDTPPIKQITQESTKTKMKNIHDEYVNTFGDSENGQGSAGLKQKINFENSSNLKKSGLLLLPASHNPSFHSSRSGEALLSSSAKQSFKSPNTNDYLLFQQNLKATMDDTKQRNTLINNKLLEIKGRSEKKEENDVEVSATGCYKGAKLFCV
jgi:hypothetical protein